MKTFVKIHHKGEGGEGGQVQYEIIEVEPRAEDEVGELKQMISE